MMKRYSTRQQKCVSTAFAIKSLFFLIIIIIIIIIILIIIVICTFRATVSHDARTNVF